MLKKTIIIYPAINLINEQCVHLYKDNFKQKTSYNDSPMETAKLYKNMGAKWLCLVDINDV
ncbi:HisA/HisF-related TIM barrel protein [Candidatus Xenohaliotis californiensis]